MRADVFREQTKIENVLASLGSTSEDVAEKLTAEGCFGVRKSQYDCPVAMYLRKAGFGHPRVGGWVFTDERGVCVKAPRPVCDFLAEFDSGTFPRPEVAPPHEVAYCCQGSSPL